MIPRRWLAVAAGLVMATVLSTAAAPAGATDDRSPALFALVIGVNRGVDADAAVLRYADDDAVRFRELFNAVKARTVLLTRLDDNSQRLYPTVAAVPPSLAAVQAAVADLATQVAAVRQQGQRAILYVVYAGHGSASDQSGYVMLEDARLTGSALLTQIIDPIGATQTHLIVDACHSFFLVLDRGPGGRRRALTGFAQLGAIAQRRDVGLLLSTSSARESHEWAGFQAGVFSHEVRSGLFGAADADADGAISYRELAAFIDRANIAVPNERFRPELFWRAADDSGHLLDLRGAAANHIEVGGRLSGHFYLEDTSGVRLADFNTAGAVRLVRPAPGRLYLRRTGDDREYVLPPSTEPLRTAGLQPQEAHAAARGAANDAFNALFALPFGADVVAAYRAPGDPLIARTSDKPSWRPRQVTGAALGVAGLGLLTSALVIDRQARDLRDGIRSDTPQDRVADLNRQISNKNRLTAILTGAGAAALGTGALLLLWPTTPVQLATTVDRWTLTWSAQF